MRLNGESLQQVDATLPGSLLAALLVDAEPSKPVSAVFSIDTGSYQVREVDLTGPSSRPVARAPSTSFSTTTARA